MYVIVVKASIASTKLTHCGPADLIAACCASEVSVPQNREKLFPFWTAPKIKTPRQCRAVRSRFRPPAGASYPVQGHSQPNWAVRDMSAFPPIAIELRTSREIRFVPTGDIASLT
jgi:hypothetical protein